MTYEELISTPPDTMIELVRVALEEGGTLDEILDMYAGPGALALMVLRYKKRGCPHCGSSCSYPW